MNSSLLAALIASGATSTTVPSAWREALVAAGAADGQLSTFLKGEGYSGSTADMFFKYLGDKGYVGTLSDRIQAASAAEDLFVAPFDVATLFANGEAGEWWSGADLTSMFISHTGTGDNPTSGDPVGCWKGQRGVFNFTNSTLFTQPLYNAPTKSLRFYSSKLFQNTGFSMMSANKDFSTFIHMKYSATTESADQALSPRIMNSSASSNLLTVLTKINTAPNSGKLYAGAYTNGSAIGSFNSANSTSYHSITCIAAADGGLYLDDATGTNYGTGMAQTTQEGYYLGIGASNDAVPEQFIKFLLCIDRKLTAQEIQDLHAYAESL